MPNQDFNLRVSLYFLIVATILLAGSLILVWLQPMGWALKLVCTTIIAVYGGYIVQHHVLLQGKQAVYRLNYQGEGRWEVYMANQPYSAELRGDSTVTTWVSVLRFQVAGRRFPISTVVFRDSFMQDEYRRLVVLLKFAA